MKKVTPKQIKGRILQNKNGHKDTYEDPYYKLTRTMQQQIEQGITLYISCNTNIMKILPTTHLDSNINIKLLMSVK